MGLSLSLSHDLSPCEVPTLQTPGEGLFTRGLQANVGGPGMGNRRLLCRRKTHPVKGNRSLYSLPVTHCPLSVFSCLFSVSALHLFTASAVCTSGWSADGGPPSLKRFSAKESSGSNLS